MIDPTYDDDEEIYEERRKRGISIDISKLENIDLGNGSNMTPKELYDLYRKTPIQYFKSANMIDITGDSGEYELLELGVLLSKDIPGMCVEIGLRLGLGTKTIIDGVRTHCPEKTVIAIDPYGSIPYVCREKDGPVRLDYDNGMKYRCLSAIYTYLIDNPVDFHFFDVEDTVFFEKHANGIEKYDLEKTVLTDYSLVFYDGPHNVDAIKAEMDFFLPRTPKGGIWIFDDCTPDFYDHSKIEDYMGINEEGGDFERIHKGLKKAIYKRL